MDNAKQCSTPVPEQQTFTEVVIEKMDALNDGLRSVNNRLYAISKRSGFFAEEELKNENSPRCSENAESTAVRRLSECIDLSNNHMYELQRRIEEIERYV